MLTRQRFAAGLAIWLGLLSATPVASGQTAGDGPYWTSIPTPANFVSLQGLGSTIYLRTLTDVSFYSGITHNWTVIPISSPTVSVFNDYAIVRDGNTIWGYSNRTGQAQAITVTASAVITNGPASSSWICVVRDGATLYGFGAFNGTWAQTTAASSTTTIAAGSYVAVVEDGTNAYAIGAHQGTWVSTPAPGVTVSAGGLMGAALDGATMQCFSSRWNTWVSQPFTGTGAPTFKDEFCFVQSPGQTVAYSALTNGFTSITYPSGIPSGTIHNRCVLGVISANTITLYAPGTGVTATLTTPNAPLSQINAEFILVDDGAGITAFSGLTGHVSPYLPGTFTFTLNEDVAYAQGSSGSFAYSAITGNWTPAPAVTPTQVQTVRNAIILATPTGYEAFAARYDSWSSLVTATPNTFVTSSVGATFCAIDGSTVAAFDTRLGRWNSKTLAAPFAQGSVWRMTLIVQDGVNLYGFSQLNDVWDQIPFTGPLSQFTANDSIAWARTATDIHVYAPNGSFSTISRFAEFTRMQSRGTPLRLVQTGQVGSQVEMALSLGRAFIPLGSLGTVVVDPNQLVGILPLGTIGSSGALDVSILVPTDPSLNGLQIFLQNVVTPPTGPIYVSNGVAPVII